MGSYIASATTNIELIVENILSSGKLPNAEALRIGLIAYRDYPPQDNSYITKVWPSLSLSPGLGADLPPLPLAPHLSLSSNRSHGAQSFDFTSDVSRIKEDLKTLYASGGGDGPEGVTAAMKATLELSWRPDASRMAVLVADAPAHGIGEYGDGFPNGGPDGEDPLLLSRMMASQGISLVSSKSYCSSTPVIEAKGGSKAARRLLEGR